MKKAVCLVLALALACIAAAAAADPKKIDGLTPRDIRIESAGLNPDASEMIAQGYSPTTGRKLDSIKVREGSSGTAVTGVYQPIMMQISNSNNGIGIRSDGSLYAIAPVNGTCADVVYEACQKKGGGTTRMTMIFSDVVPDYAGFARSTRLTHVRLRQEWDCIFCTSGYSSAEVPAAWKALGVKSPSSKNRTEKDPGVVYIGDAGTNKPWKKYVRRLMMGIKDANNELFELKAILENVVPKDHVPANHTWKFTDEVPAGGDSGEIVYVTFGSRYDTDSRLEYDPDNNAYIRYVEVKNQGDLPYRESVLFGAVNSDEKLTNGQIAYRVRAEQWVPGDTIMFNNVIVQGIKMKWPNGSLRPDPVLTGTGNADYFMGGRHYAGVWERKDIDSRTVFYGEDGKEIELQRGRTLIILMGYNDPNAEVRYE